jgi:hypothetical protein
VTKILNLPLSSKKITLSFGDTTYHESSEGTTRNCCSFGHPNTLDIHYHDQQELLRLWAGCQ